MKLDDVNKQQGFKVPEGYFDQLNQSIMKKVERPAASSGTFTLAFSPVLRFAASFLILLLIGGGLWLQQQSGSVAADSANSILATLEADDIEDYLNTAALSDVEIMYFANEHGLDLQLSDEGTQSFEEELYEMEDIDLTDIQEYL